MPFCLSEVEQLSSSAEMVAVDHYLYAGEIVGGSIEFWALPCSRRLGMADVRGGSIWDFFVGNH